MNPITALYCHLVGDYLLQNDWMARGKRHSSAICAVHVVLYLLPFLACGASPLQLLLIGAQHFAQDRTGVVLWFMRAKGSSDFAREPLAPWSLIVTDNVLHLVWNALVVGFVP